MARRLVVLSVMLLALLAALVPAVAEGRTVELRGLVNGQPYGAGRGELAVPVLFARTTVKQVGLTAPVGLLIVKAGGQIETPEGKVYPANLRIGDRVTATGRVDRTLQRTLFPRIPLTTSQVTKRSKDLSTRELQQLSVDLAKYTSTNVQQLQGGITYLASLITNLNPTQLLSTVNSLQTTVNNLLTALGDPTTLVTNVNTALSNAVSAVNKLTGVADAAALSTAIGNANTSANKLANIADVNALNAVVTNASTAANKLSGVADSTALNTAISNANSAATTLSGISHSDLTGAVGNTAKVTSLCTQVANATTAIANVRTALSNAKVTIAAGSLAPGVPASSIDVPLTITLPANPAGSSYSCP